MSEPALKSKTSKQSNASMREKLAALAHRFVSWFATLFSGKALVIWRIAMQNYRRSQLTRMAAALSFRTIFGLIPTLVVGLVVLHAFVSDEQVKSVVSEVLKFTGLDQISVDEGKVREAQRAQQLQQMTGINIFGFGLGETVGPPAAGQSVSVPPTIAAPVQPSTQVSGVQAARLDEWITTLMARIDGINFGALGLVGAVMLIYAALSMVVETEKCFNQICGASMGKTWMRRIKDYWALLTLGPLLLVASFGVRAGVERIAVRALGEEQVMSAPASDRAIAQHTPRSEAQQAKREPRTSTESLRDDSVADSTKAEGKPVKAVDAQPPQGSWLSRAMISTVKFVLSVAVSTGMLMVVFAAVPNLRVRVGPAALGAVVAALLWELSKTLLGAYIASSMKSGYAALYGAVAIVPLFMLWVYITWLIVLLGFQITSTLQQYQTVSREGFRHGMLVALGLARDEASEQGLRLVDPAAAVLVLGAVSQRFQAGLASTASDVRSATGLELSVSGMLLSLLTRGGWLHRVVASGELTQDAQQGQLDIDRFTLAKDPAEIAATDVLRFAEREGSAASETQMAALGAGNELSTQELALKPGANAEQEPASETVIDVLSAAKHRALANKSIAAIASPRAANGTRA